MKLKLYMTKETYSAEAEYNTDEKDFVVMKGSTVSHRVSSCEKWCSAPTIKKLRSEYTKDNKVVNNVHFKSASSAANFVSGVSTNGLCAWKNKEGISLKELLN